MTEKTTQSFLYSVLGTGRFLRGREQIQQIREQPFAALPVTSATIDGEAVVCDSAGVSDFDRLRAVLARGGSSEVFLYAFDLLELDSRDMRRSQWVDRRETLVRVLRKAGDGIRLSEQGSGGLGA